MKLSEFVRRRQVKYGAYVATYVAVVLAVLVLINWGVNKYNTKTWDVTANKQYSLSNQTLKIVRQLKEPVHIYYFDRKDGFRRAGDLLKQYDHLSSKLTIEYVDPYNKPVKARELQVRADGSIIVTSGDRRQEANVLTEESITNALIRLTKPGAKSVCLVEGHRELDSEDTDPGGLSRAKKALEDSNYTVKSISLLRDQKVPADCTVAIVAGPTNDYAEPEASALKSFVEGGGRAFFMIGPDGPETLVNALAGWNIDLKTDLVVEENPDNLRATGDMTMVIIRTYKSHPITRDMRRVATLLPFTRTVEPGKDSKPSVTVETLMETSSESWAKQFDPGTRQIALRRTNEPQQAQPVGVVGTVRAQAADQKTAEGRFAVFGSGRFPANYYFPANRDLFVNTVNWLASDEDLISIRPKGPDDRRMSMSEAQMDRVWYLSIIFLPLAMVASGIAVWWKRR